MEIEKKDDGHPVLLRLDDDDNEKLLHLCRLGDTNRNDILRQCLRFVYAQEFKGGAA